jgi:GTP-binding protein EngB required for normal cell division
MTSATTGGQVPTPSRLFRLAALAMNAGADAVASDAARLAERVTEGRFYVACVGQFKRGKSTLLNALVDQSILPTGIVPVTAVVTVVRHGLQTSCRVRFTGGGWQEIAPADLAAYVADDQNPGNCKGVAAVEVFVANPLLAFGMCLVDTPGVGSVFSANTVATRSFVPQIDAALVVLGADPPISGDELALVEEVAKSVPDLVLVLNKADRLSEDERHEARVFSERVLAERLRRPVTLLEVSATERSLGRGPLRDWEALCATLETLARQSGSGLVDAAERRGFGILADSLLHRLGEERGALLRPVEQSERRIAALKQWVADAEQSLNDLGYLFTAEQQRLAKTFAVQQADFLSRTIPAARAELVTTIGSADARGGPALRHQATGFAQRIFRGWLERWRAEEQPAAERMYQEAARRFVDLADGFLGRLTQSGESSLPRKIASELGLRMRSRLYYTEMLTYTVRSPLGWLADAVRPRVRVLRAVERDVGAYLERLLTTNAARLMNDLDERVLESRRRLELEIRTHLQEVYACAERALANAQARRASGEEAVRAELARIETLYRQVEALRGASEEGDGP